VNDELGKLKDEHSKPANKYCWIKADPTFSGLRQIINEPEDRVFIGRLPPKMEEVRFLIWIPYDEYGGIDNINPETDWESLPLMHGFLRPNHFLYCSSVNLPDFHRKKSACALLEEPRMSAS
jgi:hypothetical protein